MPKIFSGWPFRREEKENGVQNSPQATIGAPVITDKPIPNIKEETGILSKVYDWLIKEIDDLELTEDKREILKNAAGYEIFYKIRLLFNTDEIPDNKIESEFTKELRTDLDELYKTAVIKQVINKDANPLNYSQHATYENAKDYKIPDEETTSSGRRTIINPPDGPNTDILHKNQGKLNDKQVKEFYELAIIINDEGIGELIDRVGKITNIPENVRSKDGLVGFLKYEIEKKNTGRTDEHKIAIDIPAKIANEFINAGIDKDEITKQMKDMHFSLPKEDTDLILWLVEKTDPDTAAAESSESDIAPDTASADKKHIFDVHKVHIKSQESTSELTERTEEAVLFRTIFGSSEGTSHDLYNSATNITSEFLLHSEDDYPRGVDSKRNPHPTTPESTVDIKCDVYTKHAEKMLTDFPEYNKEYNNFYYTPAEKTSVLSATPDVSKGIELYDKNDNHLYTQKPIGAADDGSCETQFHCTKEEELRVAMDRFLIEINELAKERLNSGLPPENNVLKFENMTDASARIFIMSYLGFMQKNNDEKHFTIEFDKNSMNKMKKYPQEFSCIKDTLKKSASITEQPKSSKRNPFGRHS